MPLWIALGIAAIFTAALSGDDKDPGRRFLLTEEQAANDRTRREFCATCRRIDFDKIFAAEINDWDGLDICDLGDLGNASHCRMCGFFKATRALSGNYINDGPNTKYRLHAYDAFGFFGVGKKGCILLAVEDSKFAGLKAGLITEEHCRAFTTLDANSPIRRIPPQIELSIARLWLDYCLKNHSARCAGDLQIHIPGFKLIDCRGRKLVSRPQIIGTKIEYTALSYVWGLGQSQESLSGDLLPRSLSRVVVDAISVTLSLGFQYLWVDRYCIPQNEASSKHAQLKNMGIIYGQAILTIIAAAGDGPSHGLPGISTSRIPGPSITVGPKALIPLVSGIADEIDRSTWASRGWTYQEGLLSRRRLVFTNSQLYFQCCTMYCSEGISYPLDELHSPDRKNFGQTVNFRMHRVFPVNLLGDYKKDFRNRINEYARRELSFESDRMDAYRGVLTAFEDAKLPVGNILGVPLFTCPDSLHAILWGLSWIIEEPKESRLSRGMVKRVPEFPSWTWLGWRISSELKFEFFMDYLSDETWGLTEPGEGSFYPIEVYFEVGPRLLPWRQEQDAILQHVGAGRELRFIRLKCWTFDVQIPRGYEHTADSSCTDFGTFEIYEEFLYRLIDIAGFCTYLRTAGDEDTFRLTCIVLSTCTRPWTDTKILVVAKHCTEPYYERLGSAFIILKDAARWDGINNRPGSAALGSWIQRHIRLG